MNCLLAIDTATDALSLALLEGEREYSLHRLMPRQHQQQLFPLLHELLGGRAPAALGLQAICYGAGPGSFTGIRIAVSAAQGLGYSLGIPLLAQSSLETQARGMLRHQAISSPCHVLSAIDARIGQIYAQFFHFDGRALRSLAPPVVCPPEALVTPESLLAGRQPLPLFAVGDGCAQSQALPSTLPALAGRWPEQRPEAVDMLGPAVERLGRGEQLAPAAALPDYVQERIGWKTLAEQGRSS